jgi:hypothetical protein
MSVDLVIVSSWRDKENCNDTYFGLSSSGYVIMT